MTPQRAPHRSRGGGGSQLNVPEGLFRESFGEDWGAVLEEGRAYNALEACEALGLSPDELNERW